ncbi:MAG: EscF/YscF/HrpA family type III secretion system needle major subunit [Deltaproteobacteria bacterium]|jgi:type III secretion protein F|nr:EscF/YscF/HrpA family type III secretion system needle major subunit [Deltaproteobacteria bacterium]
MAEAIQGSFGNIGQLFSNGVTGLSSESDDIQNLMDTVMSKEGGATHEDMINLQFLMGKYNAKMELTSTVTKSMTDMLKNIAQRTG